MKPLKLGLRVWFTITSLISFLAGWMLLSHAGKPAPLIPSSSNSGAATTSDITTTLAPIPTLPPVPSLSQLTTSNSNNATTIQSLPSLPSTTSNNFFPTFRGRGS